MSRAAMMFMAIDFVGNRLKTADWLSELDPFFCILQGIFVNRLGYPHHVRRHPNPSFTQSLHYEAKGSFRLPEQILRGNLAVLF
jgi:hypothetical protein